MKPLIIYVDNDRIYGDEITLTKKEFDRIISEVYEQGREDGKNNITLYPLYQPTVYPPTTPQITWATTDTQTTTNLKY